MNNKRFFWGIVSIGVLFSTSLSVVAGQTIYQLKDSHGSTVLTNKKGSYTHLKVEKKTYYPDSNIHSYSNWGNSESAVLPSYSRNKNAFDHIIRQAAQQHGVPEGLLKAVMHTESGFNIHARSPVGAQGLMQLMPATARRFNVSNAYDPHQNIMAGARYLAWLTKRFKGNTSYALAGYNAGEGNVDKYGGIPPFRETQDYVRRVLSRYNNLYSNGMGQITTSDYLPSDAKIITKSANYKVPPINEQKPRRQIISTGDGQFSDAPLAGSYTTENAVATARIHFSE